MDLHATLLQREQQLLEPHVRSSVYELRKLLADDFFEFGSSGKILYKNEPIEAVQLGEVRMHIREFAVHPLGNEVVLATYTVYNELTQQTSLRSSIWKKVDESWKMHFHQGTLVPKA